ncbi:hypothetical protein Pfo_029469 [Paulownia fortunei]|nr:hypothetical protein Pfo_029469 [Paulownia fortunei]
MIAAIRSCLTSLRRGDQKIWRWPSQGQRTGDNSTINAGFYSRADQEFYHKLGVNWDLRVVNKSYEWVEKAVVFRPELRNWQSSVRDGLLEAGVDPYKGFSLVGTKIGGSTFDGSGRRHSAADLLNYENPVNIKVAVYATIGNEAASNVIPFASTARSVFIRNLASPLYLTAATLMEKITGPLSAGSLRLASTDVRVNPIVRFNYSGNGTRLKLLAQLALRALAG